jgi:hypothetical protein
MEKTKIINTMTNLETNYLVYIDRKRLSDDDFNKVKLHDLFNSYEIELAKKLWLHSKYWHKDAKIYWYTNIQDEIFTLLITTPDIKKEMMNTLPPWTSLSKKDTVIKKFERTALNALNSDNLIDKWIPKIVIKLPQVVWYTTINQEYFTTTKEKDFTTLIHNFQTLKKTIEEPKKQNNKNKKKLLIDQTIRNIDIIISKLKDWSLTDLELYAIIRLIMSQVYKT